LFYQPALHGTTEQNNYNIKALLFAKLKFNRYNFFPSQYINLEINIYHQITYALFIGCCLYCASFLPYGRFYNRLGGNIGMLYSYMYVFVYLGFTVFRRPVILEVLLYSIYIKTNFLKNIKMIKH
jgi:hypothetical protein